MNGIYSLIVQIKVPYRYHGEGLRADTSSRGRRCRSGWDWSRRSGAALLEFDSR
ncbi:hypothetical protein [Nonomuraea dietziae]|uniref:hypothetical protein n=1 Tax=Nonomuraea dietziae TaxID=65515 RepID=UPI0031E16C95